MNLWEIQPQIVTLLQASSRLTGVTIIADDGTYPKTPGREAALNSSGLVLIVWQIESDGLVDASLGGVAAHYVYCPVVVEENVIKNRASGGTLITVEKATQYVLEAVIGKPAQVATEAPKRSFKPLQNPFKNFGKINGVNRMIANLVCTSILTPQ